VSDGPEFLSCDWGTSSFRIRWIKADQVIREFQDGTGCRTLFDEALASQKSRRALFESFLRGTLDRWEGTGSKIPLVISGMASSTIGWQEVPYARTPLRLDASNLRFELLYWNKPPWIGETYLISGLASDDEILRGEETEAIGLLSGLQITGDRILILPGTHSKHLLIQDSAVTKITTYMTGELFDVLARHSILRATIDLGSLNNPDSANLAAFDSGAQAAKEFGLASSLFKTRTRSVLKRRPASENAWFLSGLLIGSEINELLGVGKSIPVLIGGARHLRELYVRTLKSFGGDLLQWEEFSNDRLQSAIPRAHELFLKQRSQRYS